MPFTSNKLKKCSFCSLKINKQKYGIELECMHQFHHECIAKMAIETCGEYMDFVKIKKSELIDEIEDNHETSMIIAKKNSGIIFCSECDLSYSLFSYIYRQYKIPKLVRRVIRIDDYEDDDNYYNYHLCTNIDYIHLLPLNEQKIIFKNFDVNSEDDYINAETFVKYEYLLPILNSSTNILHAVIEFSNETKKLVFVDDCDCPVCNSKQNSEPIDTANVSDITSDVSNDTDTQDIIIIKHCSLDEFISLLYKF